MGRGRGFDEGFQAGEALLHLFEPFVHLSLQLDSEVAFFFKFVAIPGLLRRKILGEMVNFAGQKPGFVVNLFVDGV